LVPSLDFTGSEADGRKYGRKHADSVDAESLGTKVIAASDVGRLGSSMLGVSCCTPMTRMAQRATLLRLRTGGRAPTDCIATLMRKALTGVVLGAVAGVVLGFIVGPVLFAIFGARSSTTS
jgi:hypothetical protein